MVEISNHTPDDAGISKLNKLTQEIKELHDNDNSNNEIDRNIFSECVAINNCPIGFDELNNKSE